MNRAEKIEYATLLEAQIAHNLDTKLTRFYESMYDWQHRFNADTKNYSSCLLMAANQVGKTRTGCTMDAYHILGDYPDDWEGHKFEKATLVWLLGYSGEKTRDLLQHKIFGRMDTVKGELAGGLIPKDRIVDYRSMKGTSGAAREVRVKHKSGGISVCQIWSYSQGQHALMGDSGLDWYHIDEEPEDPEIYPQVVTRTLNGDRGRGGRGILTFTPENGKTAMVTQFMDDPGPGDVMHRATWDDAKHLSAKVKEDILAKYPAHQRAMRSKGEPLMGAGLIYDIGEDSITIEPFDIPDYWFVIDGMDFGWDHPQGRLQLVWDRDADMYYVINAWKASKTQPFEAWHILKPWAEGVPTAWPADGLQTEKGSAKEQKTYYEEEGFWLLDEHATWEDGGNGVWIGIVQLTNLMKTGRLKIFSNLHSLLQEIRQYHTRPNKKEDGKIEIVKILDDLLDCLRYAYMMRRHAIRIMDLNPDNYQSEFHKPQGGYTGD